MTEWRDETCSQCGAEREREWSVRSIPARLEVPKRYRVESRRGGHKTIAAPTRWTTICECDC